MGTRHLRTTAVSVSTTFSSFGPCLKDLQRQRQKRKSRSGGGDVCKGRSVDDGVIEWWMV